MSTYVLMKILESTPSRYDLGIKMITLGRQAGAYDFLTSHISAGQKVLDIGCGTGALTLRAAAKGARVKAIDINAEMLDIARKRARDRNLDSLIDFSEMGVAELCEELDESYDVVMSGLCFSELSDDEIEYTLKEVYRILKKSGMFLVADETKPDSPLKRVIHWLLRLPLVVIVYILTQTTTSAVENLEERMRQAGFMITSVRSNWLGDFKSIVAVKIN